MTPRTHDPHEHPHVHPHGHSHGHSHGDGDGDGQAEQDAALDLQVPDDDLTPSQLGRRGFLRSAGVLGVGGAVASTAGLASAGPAAAATRPTTPSGTALSWLAGDHHIHTQYSSDAIYRVADQVQHAQAYGLDWMVITDHGSGAHARIGVDLVNPDIVRAREAYQDMLVFQGLEWNIPAAEHGTVFVHPGRNEVAVLKEFENAFDGGVNGWRDGTPENELRALEGLDFLATSVTQRRVESALFLANHPARNGIDSPHEIRAWRDRQPTVAIGFEGAPGHQAAGLPLPLGPGSARGYYGNAPGPFSFPGFPLESYATWGGFDWMTATVGGLWDSMLAEGKPWWISANSDAHGIYLESAVRGPGSSFDVEGRYRDPVHGPVPVTTYGDFWPGYYSRTHVGAADRSYAAVMAGLTAGRMWVDHGSLLGGLSVDVRQRGSRLAGTSLGGTFTSARGQRLELAITIDTQTRPNWAAFLPQLARVDVVRGAVTGAVTDRDTFTTPATSVVQQYDVTGRTGRIELRYDLGAATAPFYVRVRGTDGKRVQVGSRGASVDPAGPAVDVLGAADPWDDLWFYTNPIWVVPRR